MNTKFEINFEENVGSECNDFSRKLEFRQLRRYCFGLLKVCNNVHNGGQWHNKMNYMNIIHYYYIVKIVKKCLLKSKYLINS